MSNTEIKAQYLHVNVSTIWQSQIGSSTLFFLEITVRVVGDSMAGEEGNQSNKPDTELLFNTPALCLPCILLPCSLWLQPWKVWPWLTSNSVPEMHVSRKSW